MLIKNTRPCFTSFGSVNLRPGSTEVVPDDLAERQDFKDAVKSGYVVVLSKEAAEPEEGKKGWESLDGDDLLAYVEGLIDLAELKELEGYTSKNKKLQAEVRKVAKARAEEIEQKKAEAEE